MSQPLAISITLCHQFKSNYYNSARLKSCIIKSAEDSEAMLENINLVFEDIEEATQSSLVHENVINSIRKSHIVIFELSDVNPNVLYELGIANGLKKPIIVLRETNANEKLPTDLNQFIYLTYDKNKLDKFHHKLSESIIKAYKSYDELDFISDRLKLKVVDNFMSQNTEIIFQKLNQNNLVKALKGKDDFSYALKEIILNTKTNFFYVGAMGYLASGNDWVDLYQKQFFDNKVFSRIVYLKTLKEFYDIYDDEEMLVNYCIWMSINYHLLRNKMITISYSEDISIWKNGLSFVVSDEKKLLIATGSFYQENNVTGLLIENKEIAQMFKEYANILSVKSKRVKLKDMIKFYSFDKKIDKFPKNIKKVLDEENFTQLRSVCEEYIADCLND